MNLQKLPSHIIQSIISGSTPIYSYKRAVEELVYNSIDAGASSIAVRVDIDQNTIQVIDNGIGIPKQDFILLGERNATSKFVDESHLKSAPDQYGFRGQSLASIIEVSKTLKIISRHRTDDKTWIKTFYKGSNPNISETVQRPSKGTTVDVKGFLFNHNIQKKTVNSTIEIHDIKSFLAKLALVYSNLSLSLRDDTQNEIVFKLHKNRDLHQTLSSLFGIQKVEIQEYKVEKNQYKVTAFIGKTNSETSYHWMYLNGRYISESKLHNFINSGMKKSLHLNVAQKKSMNNFNLDGDQNIVKKIPNYFIFVQCPYYDYDIIIDSKKTVAEFKNWEQINKLLDKLIKFYSGSMKLKEIKVNNAKPAHKEPLQNKEEVEKIIKKILGSNKKPNVSQMQNGVKGKLIKRKLKRAPPKLSLSKVIPKRKNIDTEINNKKNHDNPTKVSDNVINSNKLETGNFPDPIKSITTLSAKIRFNNNKRNSNIKDTNGGIKEKNVTKKRIKNVAHTKNLSKSKAKKKLVNKVIKKFNEQTDSVSRKCNMLSKKVENLLNCKNEHDKGTFIEKIDGHRDIFEENKNKVAAINDTKKYYATSKEPEMNICTFDNRNWNNKKTFTKSTYDLLQTIIKSQQTANENKCETYYSIQKQSKRHFNGNYDIESQTHKYTFSNVESETSALKPFVKDDVFPSHTGYRLKTPKCYKLTYESHNYNKQSLTTNSHLTYFSEVSYSPKANNFQFITEESRENFVIPKEQDIFRNRIKCNMKNNNRNTPYTKLDYMRRIKETFSNSVHKSITIDFTESNNIVEAYHSNTDRGSHRITTYTIDSVTDDTEILRMNSQINSTYTIISNSIQYVSHDSFDKAKKESSPIKVTEKQEPQFIPDPNNNVTIETLSYNDADKTEVLKSTKIKNKGLTEENIEPLEFCQTILDSFKSNGNNECHNRRNDSLFADDFSIESALCDRNIYTANQRNAFETNFVDTANNDEAAKNDEGGCTVETFHHPQDNKYSNGIDLVEDTNNFEFKDRLRFVPKGMSQIFQNCRTKTVCNYNADEEYFEEDIYKNFINDVQTNAEVFQSEIQNVQGQTSKAIDKVNQKLKRDNSSLKFDADSLKSATVLRQVDQKFIAATIKSKITNKQQMFLVLFDQHAVHERIRLENNLSEYLQQDQWKSLPLDLSLQLNKEDVMYLHNFKDKFKQLGLEWTISSCDVSITAIPEAILGKTPRPVDVVIKTVKKLIAEEIDTIRTQKGCITLYPKAIMDLVFSEACRYAIKFGDKLTKSDCVELLKSLSECKTPFQCAHGRPVMAVLMDWRSECRSYKASATKIGEFVKRKI